MALLLIYRFLVTPGVVATVCESYTDEATCNNVITSSGSCLWQNGECTTQLGTLPPGMVAISVALERPGTPSSTSASGTGVSSPPPPSPNPAPRPEAEMPGLEPEFEDERMCAEWAHAECRHALFWSRPPESLTAPPPLPACSTLPRPQAARNG